MSYRLLRALLFRLDPELAHHLVLQSLQRLALGPLAALVRQTLPPSPCRLMGLDFPNRLGLAAGLDKDGVCIDGLGALGFGFLELGTVTPRPQPGNPRPRLFRLPAAGALINRMGFNNLGVEHLVGRIRARRFTGLIGVNLGKNKDTPLESALDDYRLGLEAAYPVADYLTVNVSSPNTPGLRALQAAAALEPLLAGLSEQSERLGRDHRRHCPLVVKISPDLEQAELQALAAVIARYAQGVIATNTTANRDGVAGLPHADEAGGLSGRPLLQRATEVVRRLRAELPTGFPIIAAGGVDSAQAARAKLAAGADLVQVYTGFIYRGPGLLRELGAALAAPHPGSG